MFETVWLLQNDRASLVPPGALVLGLGEHPFRRWGSARTSVFQQLLDEGVSPRLAGTLREVPLAATGHDELLAVAGWHRLGTTFDDGTYRVVLAQRSGSRFEYLTRREFGVAELAARAWKSHRIGAELSIAAPTVRGAIDRCVLKLDLASSVQLPLLWFTLGSPGRCLIGASGSRYLVFEVQLSSFTESLTNAERELVERLLRGDTQRAMAQHRGVSVRTVANQMSRLFEKLGVSSRTELVVRLLERGRAR
ncbi:MAG TPA: LuxR C-terminal-related transcriptional regulator [Polyangiaceae bacterium]|nr:LuxR C-terminal-related transcriptional regulator [Polyangiaceae bacterium]